MLRGISAQLNLRVAVGAEPSSALAGAVCQLGMAEINALGSWSCRKWIALCLFIQAMPPKMAGGVLVTQH